jgi:hypothetical protein
MPDPETVVATFIAIRNAADEHERRALVEEAMTEDASYVDPLMSGSGADEITEMIAGAQSQFAGHVFALHAGPDVHHDRVRFSWTLAPEGGDSVVVAVRGKSRGLFRIFHALFGLRGAALGSATRVV